MSKYKVNNTASVYVSAAHKSSGKTIISLGLSRIFSDLNHNIQTFKKGPDYIDMGWLSFASRKNSYNLDFNTQTSKEIKDLYEDKKTNINLIEGNKGLYDGVNLHGKDDNSAMSILLDVPVILVIDTQGITRGIAPLLQGYVNFEKKCNIKGIILNKVSTERHESKLINSVENYTDLKILGSVRKNKDLVISERHLGLIPANEKKVVEKKINAISNIISESISKKEFSALGINFKKKKIDKKIVQNITTKKVITKIKIGVFYDSSFGFYYADDIENLKKYGAEIVYINSVKNKKIPNVDAIFIGGGFPEINAEKLSKNKILMLNLKKFIEEEKPCYAECGGLMYLSESIKYNNKKYKMVGIIPGCVNMSEKPIGRGYVKLEVKKNHLWNSAPTGIINAHEFHHANLILNKGVKSNFSYNVKRGYGINGKSDGYMYKKLLANFTHLRNTEQYPWVKYFINFIKESKND
jgi:cobyrinic acid a,c-diamide synthase